MDWSSDVGSSDLMLLGHWIEMRSLVRTTSALDSLATLLPDGAERVEGDEIVVVSPADLSVGDVIVIRPGGSVAADGRVVSGSASMEEAMITGESLTVRSEEHTSELQSLMRISYAVFCLYKTKKQIQ